MMRTTDDSEAMRTAIGAAQRELLSDVLDQSPPAEMADLLMQLDQLTECSSDLGAKPGHEDEE